MTKRRALSPITISNGVRRSRLRRLSADDLVLTILWVLVVAGLLALLALALSILLG